MHAMCLLFRMVNKECRCISTNLVIVINYNGYINASNASVILAKSQTDSVNNIIYFSIIIHYTNLIMLANDNLLNNNLKQIS